MPSCFRLFMATPVDKKICSSTSTSPSTRRYSDFVNCRKSQSQRRSSVDPQHLCLVNSTKSPYLSPRKISRKHSFTPDILVTDSEMFRKTTRQKTETSLPSDEATDPTHLDAKNKIRRTSSMPSVCDELHKYSAEGKLLRHYNYEAKLSKLQKRALRFTWQRLQTRNGGKRIETVFEEVFERLMKQMPLMREIFTTRTFLSAMSKEGVASLRDHARMTVKMIDIVIKNLDSDPKRRTDTESELDPRILGKAHACLRPYGFNSNFWEKLGEIFIDVVLVQEAVRDLPGAGQSWVILAACLVDQLRAGFDQAKDPTTPRSSLGAPMTCPVLHGAQSHDSRRNSNAVSTERRRSCVVLDPEDDDDEHIYVNFPVESSSKSNSPMHSSPQTGSPLHHTPRSAGRSLPEEPSMDKRPSFSITTPDNPVDPIR